MSASPRCGVVGHVEWVRFAVVDRLPRSGEIVEATETWADAAGGGGVAAVQMARLAGSVTFVTAVGDDAIAALAVERLEEHGVTVHAARRAALTREAFTHLDATAERTITTLGERLVPPGGDALPSLDALDAVYVTGGDATAIRAARSARVLVATPRTGLALREAGVAVDAVVLSAGDATEAAAAEHLDAALVVSTRGEQGGEWAASEGRTGAFEAAPLPGDPVDAYGCGDSFAAALTLALGAGLEPDEALAYAARVGAAVLCGRGPYGADLNSIGPPL